MHALPIATPSLRLRPFVLEDAQRFMALNGEPTTRRWLPSHVHATPEDAVSAVGFLVSSFSSPGDPRLGAYVLAVEHGRTGELLGHVGFSPLDDEVEVSFAIAEAARGHGYGAEALLHACTWVADNFGLEGIVAVTATENAASRRTLERARFAHERDEIMQFQGGTEFVSRYGWHPPSGHGCGA
jgi:RimJ/RimL family protein N-acetyltransferase